MSLRNVSRYCYGQLSTSAKRYLHNRGVSTESIKEFGIGHCPFEIDGLISTIGEEELLEHQIIYKPQEGNIKCFVRNSIAFPFVDHFGRFVAVSFRPMQSNEVIKSKKLRKYWHTSFNKSAFLYGLYNAIPEIRRTGRAIVGEGQFDVIIAHQHGITNTIGAGGTALSTWHILTLAWFGAKEIVVVFDGDEAGRTALEKVKAKEIKGTEIKPVFLPDGEDLDSFVRSCGKDKFLEVVESAT